MSGDLGWRAEYVIENDNQRRHIRNLNAEIAALREQAEELERKRRAADANWDEAMHIASVWEGRAREAKALVGELADALSVQVLHLAQDHRCHTFATSPEALLARVREWQKK